MEMKKILRIPTRREWYVCKNCGKKLLIYDDSAKCRGVYIRCKGCGREVEIKI